MKRKLFENIEGNRFKLIRESNWADTQRHNGHLNLQRRMLRYMGEYIVKAAKSPQADEKVKTVAEHAAADIKTLDSIISRGYLDSGYQYDDNDPRNQSDQHGDTYWDNEKARTGTSREEEIESEIRDAVAKRHLDDHMTYYKQFFSRELAARLFPEDSDPMSLGDHLEEMGGHEADAAWDEEHDDRS